MRNGRLIILRIAVVDFSREIVTRRYLEIVVGIGLEPFGVVDETGEDDNAQDEEEDEERQLFGRGFERVHQDFQAGWMAR